MRIYEEKLKGFCSYCGTMATVGENAKFAAGKSDDELLASIVNAEDVLNTFESLVEIDTDRALNFLKKLPDKIDNPELFYTLFESYKESDMNSAINFLKAAANSSKNTDTYCGLANMLLAEAYYHGKLSLPISMKTALDYFSAASDCPAYKGDALYNMAMMIHQGHGTRKDTDKAWSLFEAAARAGNRDAMDIVEDAEAEISTCMYLAKGICMKKSTSVAKCSCYYAANGMPLNMCEDHIKAR